MRELSTTQQGLLGILTELSADMEYVPTKNIWERSGIETQSLVNHVMASLVKKGLVKKFKKPSHCEWKLR